MARKLIVIANWKMGPSGYKKARELFISEKAKAKKYRKVKTVLCPQSVLLSEFSKMQNGSVSLGAQDVSFAEGGSFTGEFSASLLRDIGVSFVIVGHSERRALGETDDAVSRKLGLAVKNGITPILCVGERERDIHGEYLSILRQQLFLSLSGIQRKDLSKIIVAYEPIWAIGKTADDAVTPDKLHQTSLFIKKMLLERYGVSPSSLPAIIYGGSVEPDNAEELISDGNVEGFLVGHASLDAGDFGEILKSVNG